MNREYSFCESASASERSKWHIRLLTRAGRKVTGGIDTPSLCGLVRVKKGWDLLVPLSRHHLEKSACQECVRLFERERDRVNIE